MYDINIYNYYSMYCEYYNNLKNNMYATNYVRVKI